MSNYFSEYHTKENERCLKNFGVSFKVLLYRECGMYIEITDSRANQIVKRRGYSGIHEFISDMIRLDRLSKAKLSRNVIGSDYIATSTFEEARYSLVVRG